MCIRLAAARAAGISERNDKSCCWGSTENSCELHFRTDLCRPASGSRRFPNLILRVTAEWRARYLTKSHSWHYCWAIIAATW